MNAVNQTLTPPRPKEPVENSEFAALAGRILRAAARRVGDGDVEGLAALVALRTELEEAIGSAVVAAR